MKARNIQPGDVVIDAAGNRCKVVSANATRAFKMALEGENDAFAIMVVWRTRARDFTLYHPEEDVGEVIRRTMEPAHD